MAEVKVNLIEIKLVVASEGGMEEILNIRELSRMITNYINSYTRLNLEGIHIDGLEFSKISRIANPPITSTTDN